MTSRSVGSRSPGAKVPVSICLRKWAARSAYPVTCLPPLDVSGVSAALPTRVEQVGLASLDDVVQDGLASRRRMSKVKIALHRLVQAGGHPQRAEGWSARRGRWLVVHELQDR